MLDTLNRQLKIPYTDMVAPVLNGNRALEFECSQFRNPISQMIKSGFYITLTDFEPKKRVIEKSNSLSFDASDYLPITFDDKYLTLLPTNPVINTLSEWSLTLSPPIPLDTGCYVKIYLPNDLTFNYVKIEGKGFFQPSDDLNEPLTIEKFTKED